MSEVCSSPFRSSLILNMQKKTVGLFAIASHEGGGIAKGSQHLYLTNPDPLENASRTISRRVFAKAWRVPVHGIIDESLRWFRRV
jgi:hypothetical protein